MHLPEVGPTTRSSTDMLPLLFIPKRSDVVTEYTMDNVDQFIGKEIGVSSWVMVDQARINAFAECTGDHQWIHVDEEKAAQSPLGSTIGHGFLTMQILYRDTRTEECR